MHSPQKSIKKRINLKYSQPFKHSFIYIYRCFDFDPHYVVKIAMQTKYDIDFLEDATEKLKAVAHTIRFVIVDLLYHEKELSVTESHERLEIEQAVASHHLRILKNQNIVKVSRDGKNSYYSLAKPEYYKIVESLGV